MSKARLIVASANTEYQANYLAGTDTLSEDIELLVSIDTLNIVPLEQKLGHTITLTFIAEDGQQQKQSVTLLAIEDKGVVGAKVTASDYHDATATKRYHLTVGSRLRLLKHASHSRLFIDTSLGDIFTALLIDAGYHHGQIIFETASPLPTLNQCVQAMEDNYAFLQRLLRQYGLFYYFISQDNDTCIVLTDANINTPYLHRGLINVNPSLGFARSVQQGQDTTTLSDGFVGFSQCQQQQVLPQGLASTPVANHRFEGDELTDHNFFEPVGQNSAQAQHFSQVQSLALNSHQQVFTLTGNVPEMFAGCSFSLFDESGLKLSGDYLCIQVKHHCQQPSDESCQDGLSQYRCEVTAILRTQPFKLPLTEFPPLPMMFAAKVESLSNEPTIDDNGLYQVKVNFDQQPNGHLVNSAPLRKLVNYACAHQPQATGWHFPLTKDAQVMIGCLNNDPSQAYIVGFDPNTEQPPVVTSKNHQQNRLLSRQGNELIFDDDLYLPRIILQTLGSAHYLEMATPRPGLPYLKWLSTLGTIAVQGEINTTLQSHDGFVALNSAANHRLDTAKNLTIAASKQNVNLHSANASKINAQALSLHSDKSTTLLTGRTLKTRANSDIIANSEQGNFTINVPKGSVISNASGNIAIKGNGHGNITLYSEKGAITLNQQGDIELLGSDVLTLKGQMITFDGPVSYDIKAPKKSAKPGQKSAPNIARITPLPFPQMKVLDGKPRESAEAEQVAPAIKLNYTYQDGEPVQHAPYKITLNDGTVIEGALDAQGQAEIAGVPQGAYRVVLGEDTREYQPQDNTTANPLYGKITPESAVKMVENNDLSLLNQASKMADSAGDWLWGTLQGDFNQNPSTSQIVVGTVISMIPVIDQLMDCRDVCANVMLLSDDNEANDTDGWIALTLTGIGFVPLFGSAVKGVGKVIIDNPKGAISLAAATLRKAGKGDPIKYIENINWQALGKQGSELIKEKVFAIRDALNSIIANYSWLLSAAALESLRKHSHNLTEILPKVDQGIKDATQLIEDKVKNALKAYHGEAPHTGSAGSVKKIKTDELEPPKGNKLKGAKTKPVPMKKHTPPCFTPGEALLKAKRFSGNKQKLEKEFYRQLKDQQDGINKMTVGKYLQNRQALKDLIDEHGHKKARRILTKGSAAQNVARKKYEDEIYESLFDNYLDKGISFEKAEELAISNTKKTLEELAALHDPDMIAGGDDKINRLGNTNVNSSLGSQWSKAGRVASMDEAAEKALAEFGPNAQMNVELTRCK
ncbi:contractile injection system protein, VgrG/Pvc8 family [Thalassotalea ganghwensis]